MYCQMKILGDIGGSNVITKRKIIVKSMFRDQGLGLQGLDVAN